MMGKEAAAHQIEGAVAERQSKRIGHNTVIPSGAIGCSMTFSGKMRARPIQQRHIETLFRDFASIKFFLARDNIREVLVVR